MDRASSLIFPGSRTLVGWWRQLAPYQPQSLWIGYEFLHRIDAPVIVRCDRPVDPFTHLLLQATTLEQSVSGSQDAGVTAEDLQARLHLPAAVLLRVLADMEASGFLQRAVAGGWRTTDAGASALRLQHFPVEAPERRVLPFLEHLDSAGQRVGPAQFFPLAECAHVHWQVGDAHRFEPRWLRETVEQPAEVRQSMAFPADILRLNAESEDAAQVLMDRSERVLLVTVFTAAELLCFAVKVDGWTLFDRAPVARQPTSATARWPEWFQPPEVSVWQEAWRSWCRQRQMPANEVGLCSLTYRAPRLEVQAPGRLVQRLQSSKSDLFKGEAWLLVGEGFVRTAALLALRS